MLNDQVLTKENKGKVVLLLVDPQVDFHPGGSLAVAGADLDSDRIARLILSKKNEIDEIVVTMDSHHVKQCVSLPR